MIPPAASLILADARGGGLVYLMFRGANGETGECFGTIDAAGQVAIEGGGGGASEDVPEPGPLELGSSSGMSSSGGPAVRGRRSRGNGVRGLAASSSSSATGRGSSRRRRAAGTPRGGRASGSRSRSSSTTGAGTRFRNSPPDAPASTTSTSTCMLGWTGHISRYGPAASGGRSNSWEAELSSTRTSGRSVGGTSWCGSGDSGRHAVVPVFERESGSPGTAGSWIRGGVNAMFSATTVTGAGEGPHIRRRPAARTTGRRKVTEWTHRRRPPYNRGHDREPSPVGPRRRAGRRRWAPLPAKAALPPGQPTVGELFDFSATPSCASRRSGCGSWR